MTGTDPAVAAARKAMTDAATTRVGLVACSEAKLNQTASARDLYTSQLFQKASAYAAATCDRWYILSAKYGLVHPDRLIKPYDQRLGRDTDPELWDHAVRAQLQQELDGVPSVRLVALAGVDYRRPLTPGPWPVSVPMRGMGIGQQLSWLTRQLSAMKQVPA